MLKFHPFIAGLVLVALLFGFHQYQIVNNPCYGVLRLHVIANSDSPYDQAVKLKVRDAVVKLMTQEFAEVNDNPEARRVANANLKEIEKVAQQTLTASGSSYPVNATLGQSNFPTRFYGKEIFPAGEYTAVRVVLGEGVGRNWWCVLFPPLCLNDLNRGMSLYSEGLDIRFKLVEVIKSHSLSNRLARGTRN